MSQSASQQVIKSPDTHTHTHTPFAKKEKMHATYIHTCIRRECLCTHTHTHTPNKKKNAIFPRPNAPQTHDTTAGTTIEAKDIYCSCNNVAVLANTYLTHKTQNTRDSHKKEEQDKARRGTNHIGSKRRTHARGPIVS